jgi:hypothetical protein
MYVANLPTNRWVCRAVAWVPVGRHVLGSPRDTWLHKFEVYTRYRHPGNWQITPGDTDLWQQLTDDFCAFSRARKLFKKCNLLHQSLRPNGLPTGMHVQRFLRVSSLFEPTAGQKRSNSATFPPFTGQRQRRNNFVNRSCIMEI